MLYDDYFKSSVTGMRADGLNRDIKSVLHGTTGPWTEVGGKKCLLFGTNDYLSLSGDQRIQSAIKDAIETYGAGSGGSRLTSGTYVLHEALETTLANYKGTQGCLLYNSGYMANIGAIQAICDKDWTVFSDRYNHASIVDGILLSGAKLSRYRHSHMSDLERRLQEDGSEKKLIVTDGVFSMDGDLAKLPEICQLAKTYKALVMVDDAHGMGVLGDDGMGTVSHYGLKDQVHIQMGTLSKALPGVGGFVAGSQALIDYLRNHSRSFIYTTALPPYALAGTLKALDIVATEPWRRVHLQNLTARLKQNLMEAGFKIIPSETPILALITGEPGPTVQLANLLMADGILVPAIRPPTVPKGQGRLRITLTLGHTEADIQLLTDRLVVHGKTLGLILEVSS